MVLYSRLPSFRTLYNTSSGDTLPDEDVMALEDMATDITSCEDLFGYQLINLLKNNIFRMIYYIIPVALLVFSSFDFAKLVFSDDKDGLNGAFKRFSRRAIVSVLIFLVPTIFKNVSFCRA